jgi:UDPglucose 6-dehydrogenase
MKKSIAVIGQGFVGGSLATVFHERGCRVFAYDISGKLAPGAEWPSARAGVSRFPENLEHFVESCEKVERFTGIYFLCLPTPMKPSGEADVSILEKVLSSLDKYGGRSDRIAVVKSTIPPGTTQGWNNRFENLKVVFNPEFLTEANALNDMRNQDRIILGGPRPHINRVRDIFRQAFPKVKIIKTGPTTAEMVKYVTNIHLATKVALANEFYQICNALDEKGLNIDYDKVVEYATIDARLGKTHWQVPGPMPADDTGEPVLGFGGSCFVKDINALIYQAKSLGVEPKVMMGAWTKNLEVRPQRDWEKLKGRAVSRSADEE